MVSKYLYVSKRVVYFLVFEYVYHGVAVVKSTHQFRIVGAFQ